MTLARGLCGWFRHDGSWRSVIDTNTPREQDTSESLQTGVCPQRLKLVVVRSLNRTHMASQHSKLLGH
jgi:hypothetical protein